MAPGINAPAIAEPWKTSHLVIHTHNHRFYLNPSCPWFGRNYDGHPRPAPATTLREQQQQCLASLCEHEDGYRYCYAYSSGECPRCLSFACSGDCPPSAWQ